MMQQYLRWSCGSNYGIVMPTLKWFILLSWWHSHQKIAMELKIANPSEVTIPFTVNTSDYLLSDSMFLKVLKYSTYITRLEKITKQHKTYLYVMHMIKLRFSWWSACGHGQTPQRFSSSLELGWRSNPKLNVSCYFVPGFYWGIYGDYFY